ncbi:MAG: molybdopterin molybdotransferase MoeA [Bacteroidetes bacterium]|nr:molybdopterin molybdotransferase MoeA [Bacteroidota bacterium]
MISVEEATAIILANAAVLKKRSVLLEKALGQTLAEVIEADRDFPPFDRATMDGIAISYEAFLSGTRSFHIESVQAAGEPVGQLNNTAHCIEIMTGAPVPVGTDCIIPYEQLRVTNRIAEIEVTSVERGQNIHRQGNDARQGEKLLTIGTLISPAEVALLASVGKTEVLVYELPKAAIISTGNELVDIDQQPLPHQARKSNSYALQAAWAALGGTSTLFHLPDDESVIQTELKYILEQYDVLILSGGVSKGKFDFIPQSLEALGIQKMFHQVSQKPGKPLWFGRSSTKFVFALPGNPVSTFLCFHRYVKPCLLASCGRNLIPSKAILAEDFTFNAPLTYFLQVRLRNEEGKWMAYPLPGGGSGDFVNLREADGFLELPKGKKQFQKGESFDVIAFR